MPVVGLKLSGAGLLNARDGRRRDDGVWLLSALLAMASERKLHTVWKWKPQEEDDVFFTLIPDDVMLFREVEFA